MSHPWSPDAIFYHSYPLGLCVAPDHKDFQSAPVSRLDKLYPWLDHIQSLGATALYLGPLFESSSHGYDTADYYHIDRRLGDRATLKAFTSELHRRGLRLVLDGVFNHVGRDFWAFRDLLANREGSSYASWFHQVDFSRSSPKGDPFHYEGWAGHYSLVKLNLQNPDVRRHLLDAISMWEEEFQIDGLRLDAADVISEDFLSALAAHCRSLRSDFWLMGEIVFGDYRRLAQPGRLDSTTNYECYKGLYSSLNDHNYFEIAYALKRMFGPNGLYSDLALYSFADNHDVDRVASSLKNPAHLYPLYLLLFSMPGIPSIYYGSEWGITGKRTPHSDRVLRPELVIAQAPANLPHPDLATAIQRLAGVRRALPALAHGDYQELHVSSGQLAFLRRWNGSSTVVALNADAAPASLVLKLPIQQGRLVDLLNPGDSFPIHQGQARLDPLPACWGRILKIE